MSKQYYVYIMTNVHNSVLYTGMTSNLPVPVFEHKEKLLLSFASKYEVCKLVYYEVTEDVMSAITREKQIKAGPRSRKIKLIEAMNPEWHDLYNKL